MINAAIWGCGFIADTHAEALRSNGIHISAVVGRTRESAEAFARKWNIPIGTDDPSVLIGEDVDCVHVCTPPNMHFKMVQFLLTHNKHVLCEKPLCLKKEEAQSLRDLAREKGLVCGVNFNVRWQDACQQARAMVQAPDFGSVMLVHGNYLQEFGALPAAWDWRYDPSMAGKMHAVTEIGSHWLDLVEYVTGQRICAVSAQFGCFWPTRYLKDGLMHRSCAEGAWPVAVSSEDAATIQLRFENGAIGAVVLSEVSQGRYNHLSMEITGENKSLWWNSENQNLLCFARKGGTVESNVFAFGTGFADTFRRLTAAVYSDIRSSGRELAYPTFEDGLRSVQLCEAVCHSAQENSIWVAV